MTKFKRYFSSLRRLAWLAYWLQRDYWLSGAYWRWRVYRFACVVALFFSTLIFELDEDVIFLPTHASRNKDGSWHMSLYTPGFLKA